jgi:hypothetical protein
LRIAAQHFGPTTPTDQPLHFAPETAGQTATIDRLADDQLAPSATNVLAVGKR